MTDAVGTVRAMADHAFPLLDRIREDHELAALMAWFEFDLRGADHVEFVELASGARLDPVAGCGAGGTYFLCGDGTGEDRPVLYADSEGSAALFADDLRGALTILVGLPAWQNCHFSRPGGIEATIAEAEEFHQERLEDDPDYGDDSATVAEALGLDLAPRPELIRRLHAAWSRTLPDYVLLNEENGSYHVLF
ncbi:hypothetical protein NE236_09480 [Actinoallomurus purpureus]|uniref:hypothetical protein n=1 Tax=Actinoallomurus purpureus TaxID=478114 RepID=UPI002092F67F|nr:hypothetical protein [Actinoallomurus purpureus]MCO6005215.1 hypothetical protein [Actinoallomurus purpureus]